MLTRLDVICGGLDRTTDAGLLGSIPAELPGTSSDAGELTSATRVTELIARRRGNKIRNVTGAQWVPAPIP